MISFKKTWILIGEGCMMFRGNQDDLHNILVYMYSEEKNFKVYDYFEYKSVEYYMYKYGTEYKANINEISREIN